MTFFGVYRSGDSSLACWARSAPWKDRSGRRSSAWESAQHQLHGCSAIKKSTGSTDEEVRFVKAKEQALLEQEAVAEVKAILGNTRSLKKAMEEAEWQCKVHERAREILKGLWE